MHQHMFVYFSCIPLKGLNHASLHEIPEGLVVEAIANKDNYIDLWRCTQCKYRSKNNIIYLRQYRKPNYKLIERDCELDKFEYFPSKDLCVKKEQSSSNRLRRFLKSWDKK